MLRIGVCAVIALTVTVCTACGAGLATRASSPAETISSQFFNIQIAETLIDPDTGSALSGPFSGRLIVHVVPYNPGFDAPPVGDPARTREAGKPEYDALMEFYSESRAASERSVIAAMDVNGVMPGDTVRFDGDQIFQPRAFSTLQPGDYSVAAILDRDHNYAFAGRDAGDLSSVAGQHKVTLPASSPTITIDRVAQSSVLFKGGRYSEIRPNVREIDFVSPSLSTFHGKETRIGGWVVLPPGYDAGSQTFPVVYSFGGYGSTRDNPVALMDAQYPMYDRRVRGTSTPPMIWVLPDHAGPTGMTEFADSSNNGPWGKALTEELIPYLESKYRMDATAGGRFLTGHSSGGWAALWLQVMYPKLFGGAWATAPDPVDFRDFSGINLYEPHANVFYAPDGTERPLVRERGQVKTTFKAFSDFETVRGPIGGQLASFEWVFSPSGPDGKPLPLFNRKTGDVDPRVAHHWRDHYDISHYIASNWSTLRTDLDGKLHIVIGTEDTFYLDGSVRLLQTRLAGLGATSDIRFVPGRSHFNLNMQQEFAIEIYRTARPSSDWRPVTTASQAAPAPEALARSSSQ